MPLDARSVLAIIVGRGDTSVSHSGHWTKEIQIPVSVLRSLVACSAADLKRHVAVLEHFELLYLDDDPFDGPLST